MIRGVLVLLCVTALALPAAGEPRHGLAVLGSLKYPADFKHFDYADPTAPKGGSLTFWYNGNFDSLNPFILKGRAAAGSDGSSAPQQNDMLITFESLLLQSKDEPDSYYGMLAKTVEIADDKQSVRFNMRPEARFHDGSPVTAGDVVFSFETLKTKGHPRFRILLKNIAKATAIGEHQVRFNFAVGAQTRDLPSIAGSMPILSKQYYQKHDFTKTSLKAPLGSGPYEVAKVDPGRSISYRRVADHWGRNLPVYMGRINFDEIRFIYFRDRDISREALFAGKLDFREEFTSRAWATQYDKPAVRANWIKRESLPDNRPAGFQSFYLNLRRAKFEDPRTRQAVAMLFDFEWTNRNLFHSLYDRTYSIFQNSDLEAREAPSAAELALLEPYRGVLPNAVFERPYKPEKTDGSGNIRGALRQARKLLKEAGWRVKDTKMVDAQGQPFEIEFLSFSRGFERIIAPYIRNLARLGIEAKFRLVEPAQYQSRIQSFDFDIITLRWSMGLTPGIPLRNQWHSSAADIQGSYNYLGLKSPAVDALVDKIIDAKNREELTTAARALDRVIMWGHYVVPQWFKAAHHIAYWDRFGRPKIKPKYARGVWDLWWVDKEKEAALALKRDK